MDTAACIGDEGVDPAEVRLKLGKQRIETGEIGNIGHDAGSIAAEVCDRTIQRIRRRAVMMTRIPDAASFRAMANPIPLLPPVTTATLALSDAVNVLLLLRRIDNSDRYKW